MKPITPEEIQINAKKIAQNLKKFCRDNDIPEMTALLENNIGQTMVIRASLKKKSSELYRAVEKALKTALIDSNGELLYQG